MEGEGLSLSQKAISLIKKNLLVVLLFAVGLILVSYGFFEYAKPQEKSIEFGTEETKGASTTNQIQKTILVDIQGAVVKPGVYELEDGSRIKDIIEASGGLSSDVNYDYVARTVNQAQKLTDGQKIYIPFSDDDVSNLSIVGSKSAEGLIGINSASKSKLEELPRIGPITADKIISGRPYSSLEDLVSKNIVSQKVYDEISPLIDIN